MSAPIRIAQVMEAVAGGTQRHLLDLALGLDPARFEQHLVVSLERSRQFVEYIPALAAREVSVTELPMHRQISPRADWRSLSGLTQMLRNLQPQIVHGHSAKGGFLARLAARRAGVPHTIYTPHVVPFQANVSGLRRRLYLALERYAARATDFIVAVSASERQAVMTAGLAPPSVVVLIRNGIPAADYSLLEGFTRQQIRRELGADEDSTLIGAVGELRPQKGYDILIKATRLLIRAGRRVRVVIAGDGPLQGKLRRMIARLRLSDVVVLLGHRDDVPRLLGALDLFVMPSLYEGCPYGLLEAMATAVPVVATAVPGIMDIIQPRETGWLVPPGDPEGLAVQIAQALACYDHSQVMAWAARRLVEEEYDRDRMLRQTAQLYQYCVSGE